MSPNLQLHGISLTPRVAHFHSRFESFLTQIDCGNRGPGSGGGFDELEVELDLDHIAEHHAERAEAQIEVLAADLAGGLEAGVAGAVEERLDTAELDVELDRTSDLADCELAVEYPASADDRSSRSPKCTRSARFANLAR